jgi:hypothetical protein
MKRILVLGAACIAAALAAGCRETRVASTWRGDREIAIDGKKADWSGVDVYQFEDKKLYLGLANDAGSLYLLLMTRDRSAVMQGITRGLQVRFVPEMGDGLLWVGCPKAAGFMPGRMAHGEGGPSRGDGDAPPSRFDLTLGDPGDWGDPDEQDPDDVDRGPGRVRGSEGEMQTRDGLDEKRIQALLDDLPKEIEMYGHAGGDSLRLSFVEAARRGVEEIMGLDEGYLVLEMRVPLVRDAAHPQAIGLPPGALEAGAQEKDATSVELNFRIPKRQVGEERDQRRGGGEGMPPGAGFSFNQDFPGGGGGGGGFPRGGGRRGGMGGRGGGRPGMPGAGMNGLDMTILVTLASGAASAR